MSSGTLNLRLPTGLHAALAAEAARQKVSLNTLMVALLAGGIGFKLEETPQGPLERLLERLPVTAENKMEER